MQDPAFLLAELTLKLRKHQSGCAIDTLLCAVVAMQQHQIVLLETMRNGIDRLLKADFNAAVEHLKHASVPGRADDVAMQDIAQARNLFIRAVGQAPYWPEQGAIRTNIALCAFMLGDTPLAISEIEEANEQLENSAAEAKKWQCKWEQAIVTAGEMIDSSPEWWATIGRNNAKQALLKFKTQYDGATALLRHVEDLLSVSQQVRMSICR